MLPLTKKLKNFHYEVLPKHCVGVVIASKDYPNSPKVSEKITFSNINYTSNKTNHISFAGVDSKDSALYASGGRVCVSIGIADNLKTAQINAYALAKNINFNGAKMRNDIAAKAFKVD